MGSRTWISAIFSLAYRLDYSNPYRDMTKRELNNLIAQGKPQMAIKELLLLSKALKDQGLNDEIVLQSARYEKYAEANRMGTSTTEEGDVSIAKINKALLDIIAKLPEDKLPKAATKQEKVVEPYIGNRTSKLLKPGLLIVLLVAAALGFKAFLGGGAADSFSLTVLVHGKAGKDDRILSNQGKVMLDMGTARQEASINEKGEATFKELPASYIGKKSLISIVHPQPYFPVKRDQEYILGAGKAIYLEVELKGINKVKGTVLDFETENPLDSVRVSYQSIATWSDEFGWYELNIPPELQAKFVRINFYKEGFIMQAIDSIAPHLQQEIGISLQKQSK